jgi:hypothetical protein
MLTPLDVPELVRQRAMSNGIAGRRWLDDLPETVAALTDRWHLELGNSFRGGTAAFVAAAMDRAGRPCVLKVAMPLEIDDDSFDRSVRVHQLARGMTVPKLVICKVGDAGIVSFSAECEPLHLIATCSATSRPAPTAPAFARSDGATARHP